MAVGVQGKLRTCLTGIFLCLLWMALGSIASAALPDGRAYEQVTPIQKNGADVIANAARTRAAADGNVIQYASLTGFGDVQGMGVAADYVAVRDASGAWRTHAITPPQGPTTPFDLGQSGFEPQYVGDFSGDLSHGVFVAKTPLTNAPNVAAAVNLYVRDNVLTPGAGSYHLLSSATTLQDARPNDPFKLHQPFVAGASADFSHIIFESTRNLTADAVAAGLDTTEPKLYEWVEGSVRLAGVLPNTEGSGPTTSQAGQSAQRNYTANTISQDGTRVIFTGPPFSIGDHIAGVLYVRDDQGTPSPSDDSTVRASASERTDCIDDPACGGDGIPDLTPDPANPGGVPPPAMFWAATTDGTKIIIYTSEQLTDDDINASTDAYMFDLTKVEGHRLTRLSVDSEPSDNVGTDLHNGHDVSGVIGASADGSYVYFTVSQGQLVAGGPTGPTGGPSGVGERIFVWHNGTIREVGAVNNAELNRILGKTGWGALPKWSRITPDGTHMVFVTQGTDELLGLYGQPSYDHGDSCSSLTDLECQEIYVYDATANGGSGGLQCASCNPTRARATADADFYAVNNTTGGGSGLTSRLSRVISDDGKFVFFNTAERLTSDDQNQGVDAYEFNTHNDQVYLLSSGHGSTDSVFLDASPDGHDVFFTTRDQLRSGDTDQSRDLYDARINGSPDPGPSLVHPCSGDDCRDGASSPHAPPAPASSLAAQSRGDLLDQPNTLPVFVAEPLTVKQRQKLGARGHARLTLAASKAGALSVRVSVQTGAHVRTIQAVRITLTHGARVRVQLHLDRAASRQLSLTGRLRLVIRTSYSQVAIPQVQHITLRNRP